MTKIIHFRCDTKYNIGDAAVAYSIQDILSHYLKISAYTTMDIRELKLNTPHYLLPRSLVKFRNLEVTNKLIGAVPFQLSKIIGQHGGVLSESQMIAQCNTEPSELSDIINQHDLCVIGGAGIYSTWFLPMNDQLLRSIQIPIVLYGLGHNIDFSQETLTEAQMESILALNDCAKLTSVRDMESFNFLERMNIKNVHVICDPAIFLGSKRTDRISFDKDKLRIGVNIACHGWALQGTYLDKIIGEYEKTCNYLIDNLNAQIIYLQHTPLEKYAISKLRKSLQFQVADYSPYEMKWVYSNLDLVIGVHLHSAILAFGSCVPVIMVAYNIKNHSFMELINQSNNVIDARDIDSEKLIRIVSCALSNANTTRNDFKQLKNYFWQKQLLFINNIKSLIGTKSI